MKEFRLQIRIKNNLLVKRREELGLSLVDASEGIGISMGTLLNYENLKTCPLSRKGDGSGYKGAALKIADFYKCVPEDLWPDTVRRVEKNRIEREVSAAQVGHLSGASTVYASLPPDELCELKEAAGILEKVMDQLNPREKDMVMRHYGMGEYDEQTLEGIGKIYGVNRERVRQIILKACRKMGYGRFTADGNGYRLKNARDSMVSIRSGTGWASTYEGGDE